MASGEQKEWLGADRGVVHVVVPTLPRDALLEVQLLAAPLSPALPLAALQLPAASATADDATASVIAPSCHVHASFAPASFSSIWAAVTVPHSSNSSSTDGSAAASLDPATACELLVSRVEEAMSRSGAASKEADDDSPAQQWSWSNVLVFRIYLSTSASGLSERDARIGLHRALSKRQLQRIPALSILHVNDVRLHGIRQQLEENGQATTLLAAHLLLLPATAAATQASAAASAV